MMPSLKTKLFNPPLPEYENQYNKRVLICQSSFYWKRENPLSVYHVFIYRLVSRLRL